MTLDTERQAPAMQTWVHWAKRLECAKAQRHEIAQSAWRIQVKHKKLQKWGETQVIVYRSMAVCVHACMCGIIYDETGYVGRGSTMGSLIYCYS